LITEEDALRIVRESIALICNAPATTLSDQTRPKDVRGWDSFGRLQVALEIERRLGLALPLKELVAAETIGELAVMVADLAP
jgi:acyl carrier protein